MSDKNRAIVLSSAASSSLASSGGVPGAPGVKYSRDEIYRCITELDEMLAEYDTSLPYTNPDTEAPSGDSQQLLRDAKGIDSQKSGLKLSQKQSHHPPSGPHPSQPVSNLVAVDNRNLPHSVPYSASPLNGNNKLVDQNQNLDWGTSRDEDGMRNNNGPVIHTSHLIQIPVVEPPPPPSSSAISSVPQGFGTFNKKTNNTTVEMNGNSIQKRYLGNDADCEGGSGDHVQKKKGKSSGPPAAAGGTYSKGTSYEILLPKLNSSSFSRDSSISSGKGTVTTSSHSSRASIMVPVIESDNSTPQPKTRAQLNMGIFQPTASQSSAVAAAEEHATHIPIPVEVGKEILAKGIGTENPAESPHRQQSNGKSSKGVSSTYISGSEGKSSLGQSSSGSVSSAMLMMMKGGDDEQWNFPSDKNLPRSLRKTRKTCFLDEGDGGEGIKLGKSSRGDRAESPYCSDSNGMSSASEPCSEPANSLHGEVNGRNNGSCHKSPRVMPRRGIPTTNKDSSYVVDGSRQVWHGQQQIQAAPYTTIVSTSSSSSSNVKELGRGEKRKVYEDVVILHSATSNNADPCRRVQQQQHHHQSSAIVTGSSSPSSTFTSSSGVSLSVTSNPTMDKESCQQQGLKPKRNFQQQQQQQQQQPSGGKSRVRQQIPSPGTELPSPSTHFVGYENQFVPLANGRGEQEEAQQGEGLRGPSKVSCIPVTMSSHHSPESVEIRAEEEHRGDELRKHERHASSPIKICQGQVPKKVASSVAADEFQERSREEMVVGRRGKNNQFISSGSFDPVPQEGNGSLPNQSQMMRMMMMMKPNGKNSSVGSASSSSRSSSSSGSVSVKSSSASSENNCVDAFHENIVQDFPTNIFSVATTIVGDEGASGRKKIGCPDTEKLSDDIVVKSGNSSELPPSSHSAASNSGVVLRAKGAGNGRGNVQHGNGSTGLSSSNQQNSTLEIDDGYLSMINRNEAPLLWPEEFIENETFSKDELKRFSVHLNDESDEGSTNSHSPPHPKTKINGDIVPSCVDKGNFSAGQNRSSISSSSNSSGKEPRKGRRVRSHGGAAGRSSTEKTDYFSDDSLEMEGEDELLGHSTSDNSKSSGEPVEKSAPVRPSTSFVIPFHTKPEKVEEIKEEVQGRKQSEIKLRKSNSQVSRIPKMVSPSSASNRQSTSSSVQKKESFTSKGYGQHSENTSPTLSSMVRKPCSFFIPFASSDTQTNLCGVSAGKVMASSSDSYVVGSALTQNSSSTSTRSTSLPSSRRNSDVKQHQNLNGIMWSVNTSPTPLLVADGTRPRQIGAKASSDTYVTDSSKPVELSHTKQSEGPGEGGPSQEKSVIEKEEEVVIVNNSNEEEANRLVEITTTATSTTITTNSTKSACGTGDILSKREKFQKQQTFIVSPPCRDICTTSAAGQRLIEPDNDDTTTTTTTATTSSITPSTTQRLTTSDENEVDFTDDLTNDSGPNQVTCFNEDNNHSKFQTDQQIPEKKGAVTESRNEADDAWDVNQKQKKESGSDSKKCEGGNHSRQSPDRNGDSAECKNSTDMKKIKSELNPWSNSFNQDPLSERNGTTSIQLNSPTVEDDCTEESKKERKDCQVSCVTLEEGVSMDNQTNGGEHESVAEELESVVKMFLKATEGLLHPEEEESELGTCGSLQAVQLKVEVENVKNIVDSQEENTLESEVLDGDVLSELRILEEDSGDSGVKDISNISDMTDKQPLMTSTPIPKRSPGEKLDKSTTPTSLSRGEVANDTNSNGVNKRLSFILVAAESHNETDIEDLLDQPPTFIPEPPPAEEDDEIGPIRIVAPPHATIGDTLLSTNHHPHHNLDGKTALDLLSQRITSRKCPSPVENMSVSQFLHNKKNIWAMYDRPYDEDVLPANFPKGYASRSQENLVDAMTHERLTKSFSARGQSSTLPLNCRPPPVQRRTSTFRNMFNKFRKHKNTDTVIPEGPELRDEEAQSITSRETGPSEGKKRGFFSRLFRRSRKH